MGGQDQLEPDGVAAPAVERQVLEAGGLGGADAILDPGALAVPQLQPGDVTVGLVGHKHLEAVPVGVGEAQLGAGMGVLPAADRPGARRPSVQVHPAGQLAGLGAVANLAVGLQRRCPGMLGLGQDGFAHVLVDLHAQAEADAALAQGPGELAAAAGAVASDQHRPLLAGDGQLGHGEVDQLNQVGGGAGGALPGRSRPASGSPGAGPRSR